MKDRQVFIMQHGMMSLEYAWRACVVKAYPFVSNTKITMQRQFNRLTVYFMFLSQIQKFATWHNSSSIQI